MEGLEWQYQLLYPHERYVGSTRDLYVGRGSGEAAEITQDGGQGLWRPARITHIKLCDDTFSL